MREPFWRESETAAVSLSTRMGCNLCSLQKREEHYKLLYEISQVRHAIPADPTLSHPSGFWTWYCGNTMFAFRHATILIYLHHGSSIVFLTCTMVLQWLF